MSLINGLHIHGEEAKKKPIQGKLQQPAPLEIGMWYDMKVTSVASASKFGVQLAGRTTMINHIQKICQESGPEEPPLRELELGNLCLARFDVDNNWYRAFIREIDVTSGYATVYFIDYGNMDDCNIENGLKVCPTSIKTILPQVIECHWVGADPAGKDMEKIVEKLDTLVETEECIKAKVLDFDGNSDWLINEGDGNGPVLVSVPVLEAIKGVNPSVIQKYTNDTVDGLLAEQGMKKENGYKVDDHCKVPVVAKVNGVSHDVGKVDNLAVFYKTSPGQDKLLQALDELTLEIKKIRLQIVNMGTDNPGPMVRHMTAEESASRVQECKAESAQYDKRINSLFQLISEKDAAIKKALYTFDNDIGKMQALIREKDEELVKFRDQAKQGCL